MKNISVEFFHFNDNLFQLLIDVVCGVFTRFPLIVSRDFDAALSC